MSKRDTYRKFGYKIRTQGFGNIPISNNSPLVIIANHRAAIDPIILATVLPIKCTFVVGKLPDSPTVIENFSLADQKKQVLEPLKKYGEVITYEPLAKTEHENVIFNQLVSKLNDQQNIVIFPEQLPATELVPQDVSDLAMRVAKASGAIILPVHIEGSQTHASSPMENQHWKKYNNITITFSAAKRFAITHSADGEEISSSWPKDSKREIFDLLTCTQLRASRYKITLPTMLLNSCIRNGAKAPLVQDHRSPLQTIGDLMTKSLVLGAALEEETEVNKFVGIMMPNATATMVLIYSLLCYNRRIAMLNFTSSRTDILSSCISAQLSVIYTSRQLVEQAKLQGLIGFLKTKNISVRYLEDYKSKISIKHKLLGLARSIFPILWKKKRNQVSANDPAVMLFTSGSEAEPKGVVLSHQNVVANCFQVLSRIECLPKRDNLLGMLPVFHTFGFMAGMCLPIAGGFRCLLYPDPLNVKQVIKFAYFGKPTLAFASDVLLRAYAKSASAADFATLRAVYAGAEPLTEITRKLWLDKFAVPIYQGYGMTECSPVVSVNSIGFAKAETIGRPLNAIDVEVSPIDGIEEPAGELLVRGPNVMLGYVTADMPGQIVQDERDYYHSGDIVAIDEDGFITIKGRIKRFAKIGGEMISLPGVENWINQKWSEHRNAVVCIRINDADKILLATENSELCREDLVKHCKESNFPLASLPKEVLNVDAIPVFATGKIDYPAVERLFISDRT